jgi:hypothetical protein
LNKLRVAGYLPMQSKAELFLASRGGEGKGLASSLPLSGGRGGEEECKRCDASSASS